MIGKLLRNLRMKRALDASLRQRRAARSIRAASARKGQSTYWRNAGIRCRETFGVPG